MGKNTLLGSIEDLDAIVPTDTTDAFFMTSFDSGVIKTISAMLTELCKEQSSNNDAIERLTAIKDVISVYGISRPVMEACDPRGELVQRGLIGAYENLGIECMVGEVSTDAIRGITTLIDDIQSCQETLFSTMLGRADEMSVHVKSLFKSIGAAIDSAHRHIKGHDIDEKKFGEQIIRASIKQDFDRVVSASNTVFKATDHDLIDEMIAGFETHANDFRLVDSDEIEKLIDASDDYLSELFEDKDVEETLGIVVYKDDSNEPHKTYTIKMRHSDVVNKRGTVEELGWKYADLHKAVTDIRSLLDTLSEKAKVLSKNIKYVFDSDSWTQHLPMRELANGIGAGEQVDRHRKMTLVLFDALTNECMIMHSVEDGINHAAMSVLELLKAAVDSVVEEK